MKLVSALILSSITLAAATARADDSSNVAIEGDAPVRHHPPPSTRFFVMGAGLAVAGAGWGIAFGAASGWPTVPGADQLKIPIVGPWIALGKSGCASDDPDCGAKVYVRGVLYVLDALMQLGGVGLIAQGAFMKTEPSSKAAAARPGFLAWKRPGFEVRPLPIVGAQLTGLGVAGSF